jgi:hypothetical protein
MSDDAAIIRLSEHRPYQCGFCIDAHGGSEWFCNHATLRRHVVALHIFGGPDDE